MDTTIASPCPRAQKQMPAPTQMRELRRSLACLFRDEHTRLVRVIARITGPADAEDVAQATFIRMLEAAPDLDELRSARAYLYRIAHNIAIDHVRRHALAKRIFHPGDLADQHEGLNFASSVPDVASGHDTRETLRKVSLQMEELPLKCRQAFMLSKVEENTYPEIALEMKLSVSMVEKYLSRALSHIRNTVPYEFAA